MCHIAHVSKRCQVVKKMSSCQKDVKCHKVKHMDYGGGSQKKINWHNEVHRYWCQFWHHRWWWPKTLKMGIESVFEQFWWPSYLTSKLTSICVNLIMSIYFFVNLLHSPHVWFFNIWHLFDNLTSFWQLDIFLTIFNLNHLSLSQGPDMNGQKSGQGTKGMKAGCKGEQRGAKYEKGTKGVKAV